MLDLELAIQKAHMEFAIWTRERVQELMACVAGRISGVRCDWDVANESWAVMSASRHGVAYICAKIPIIIVASRFVDDVRKCAKVDEAVIFEVSDFDDYRCKIAKSVLETILRYSQK